MGWTATHKQSGQSLTNFFIQTGDLRWSSYPDSSYTVLESAFVRLSEYYAAVECIEKATGAREVFAFVATVKLFRKGQDGYNISYKSETEDVGPIIRSCPARILDLLTPTEDRHAIEWRQACRDRLAKLAVLPTFKPGTKLEFAEPIRFKDGSEATQFVVRSARGGKVRVASATNPTSTMGWVSRAMVSRHILDNTVIVRAA